MAGHSKWNNIQHRKGAQDAKRGKIFTKLIKEIIVAAKTGGGVMENNPSLRAVVDKALAANMKKDTIENAIKRGSGELDGEHYEDVRYEGYGIGGTAIMVECLTDNRNRTVAEVRHTFTKAGGKLGTDGSVSYLFTKQGIINFAQGNEDEIMEYALEFGAQDIISNEDNSIDIITTVEDFFTVKDGLMQNGLTPTHSDILQIPSNYIHLNPIDTQKFIKFIDTLENIDDVQDVYHNADISAEILKQL